MHTVNWQGSVTVSQTTRLKPSGCSIQGTFNDTTDHYFPGGRSPPQAAKSTNPTVSAQITTLLLRRYSKGTSRCLHRQGMQYTSRWPEDGRLPGICGSHAERIADMQTRQQSPVRAGVLANWAHCVWNNESFWEPSAWSTSVVPPLNRNHQYFHNWWWMFGLQPLQLGVIWIIFIEEPLWVTCCMGTENADVTAENTIYAI